MPRSLKIYIFLLLLVLVGIIYVDATQPKPINWTPSYALNDKIPFGLYVFGEESETLFKNQKINRFNQTPYEYFYPKYDYEDSTYTIKGDFLFVNDIMNLDKTSVDELFYYVSRGNNAFISATTFSQSLKDSLHFDTEISDFPFDSIALTVNNTILKPKNYYYNKQINDVSFTLSDSTYAEILGHQTINKKEQKPNFIKIPYVNGNFYLHTQPVAFTNYYMLKKQNSNYTAQICSYINDPIIHWNANYYTGSKSSSSPMRYILSQPALKWAWWLSLISILIFMIFNAKRKQRIIPIVEPEKNTTIEFAKTIGNLYYLEGNHYNLMEKKIVYFLDKVRNEYLVDTFNLDETFINRLHQKSNRPKEEITKIVVAIKKYRNQLYCSEKDIIEFNTILEKINL